MNTDMVGASGMSKYQLTSQIEQMRARIAALEEVLQSKRATTIVERNRVGEPMVEKLRRGLYSA